MESYYSIRMYVEEYPTVIKSDEIMGMADKISSLFGCKYDRLGYTLLHPDYDYKDLGIMLSNSLKNREQFKQMSIPLKYYGKKEEMPSAPQVTFELFSADPIKLPLFSIIFEYPEKDSQYLCVQINVKARLLQKKLTLKDFKYLQDILRIKKYSVNSAFVHYYSGNTRAMLLEGIECGIITINDWRLIDHVIRYRENWKNKMMDVFYMNAIRKEVISKSIIEKIQKVVGTNNYSEENGMIMFKLPQSVNVYLLNRFIPTCSRKILKNMLQKKKSVIKMPP